MELPPPLAETIAARLGVRACRSEPLARHTSFRIGGPADLLVVPETVDELAFVLRAAAAVEGLDGRGELVVLPRAALAFRYRGTALPPRFVVTAVRFALRAEAPDAVRGRLEDVRRWRVASQPHGRANAGSMFKNPAGDHAGRLIDVAGLKGARIGRA